MATLGRLWAGNAYGTNTGNLFAELDTSGQTVTGTIRFMDNAFGLVVYSITGAFNGSLTLSGDAIQAPPGIETGQLKASAVLTPDGNLRGEWETTLGTGGTFQLFPHDAPLMGTTNAADKPPEQIYTRNISVGAVRLDSSDIDRIVHLIQNDFLSARPIITYTVGGNEVTKYYEDFKSDPSRDRDLRLIKIMAQEPEAHGINRAIFVELSARGENFVRTQGIHEPWVIGKAESVAQTLRAFKSRFVTSYKKFGLYVNQAIFFAMLIFLPGIRPLEYRALFIAAIVVLLFSLFIVHARFIPNTLIFLEEKPPSITRQLWPTILSWLGAVAAAFVAALLFYWTTRISG